VTSETNDTRQLYPMAKATKDTLGVSNVTVVADAGYSSGTAAAACEADGVNARFQADPNLIRQRRCASEHPFGIIKRMTAGGRFLTRGLRKVSAEAALSVLAHNIIRTINLVGAATLRASLA
jgi:IS5 family transposase